MKKLIIAVAIVCASVCLHAATYSWTVSQNWVSADNENALEVAVYAFDENAYDMATLTSALAGGDLKQLDHAIGSGVVNADGAVSISGSGLTDDGGTPANASMYALVMDKSSGSYSYFYSVVMDDVEITDAVTSGGAEFVMENGDDGLVTGAIGGSGWTKIQTEDPEGTPEPTSAVLMLVGLAGLALRRKQE